MLIGPAGAPADQGNWPAGPLSLSPAVRPHDIVMLHRRGWTNSRSRTAVSLRPGSSHGGSPATASLAGAGPHVTSRLGPFQLAGLRQMLLIAVTSFALPMEGGCLRPSLVRRR